MGRGGRQPKPVQMRLNPNEMMTILFAIKRSLTHTQNEDYKTSEDGGIKISNYPAVADQMQLYVRVMSLYKAKYGKDK